MEATRTLAEHQARTQRRIEDAGRARERQWAAGRFKNGDRVSAVNDGLIKTFSGVYSEKPRLYGTVVDTDIHGSLERYAVKWDSGSTVWITGRDEHQRATK